MTYESVKVVASERMPGVELVVRRISFGRRMELMRAVRELAQRVEFLDAGDSPGEKMDAALIWAEIDRLYVRWGLAEVRGLEIDGAAATPESLAEAGPEEVFREAAAVVRRECGLTDAQRKN